jgi:hypothetical protein
LAAFCRGWGFPNFLHLADMEERMLDLQREMGSYGAESSTRRRASTSLQPRRERPSRLWHLLWPYWWISSVHCSTMSGDGARRGAPRGIGSFGCGRRTVGRAVAFLRPAVVARGLRRGPPSPSLTGVHQGCRCHLRRN